MAFKLAIDDKVLVTVKGKFKSSRAGADLPYQFKVLMDRVDQDQISEAHTDGGRIADFLASKAHGWEDQRLVLDEATGKPAEFSEDAFRALLRLPGMGVQVYRAYMTDVSAQEKN
jgi:hypothetical protein